MRLGLFREADWLSASERYKTRVPEGLATLKIRCPAEDGKWGISSMDERLDDSDNDSVLLRGLVRFQDSPQICLSWLVSLHPCCAAMFGRGFFFPAAGDFTETYPPCRP